MCIHVCVYYACTYMYTQLQYRFILFKRKCFCGVMAGWSPLFTEAMNPLSLFMKKDEKDWHAKSSQNYTRLLFGVIQKGSQI